MKATKVMALAALAGCHILAFSTPSLALTPAKIGKVIVNVTGGGYLENGYKCGIGLTKKEVEPGKTVTEGTLHCVSVTATKGKLSGKKVKHLVDCEPVDVVPDCVITSSHPVATATIACVGGKVVNVVSGVQGDPMQNGEISATGWGYSSFPLTPVLHGVVNVDCK